MTKEYRVKLELPQGRACNDYREPCQFYLAGYCTLFRDIQARDGTIRLKLGKCLAALEIKRRRKHNEVSEL